MRAKVFSLPPSTLAEKLVDDPSALFKLSRYFVEKQVEQKLEGAMEKLKETLHEIEASKWIKKDAYMCPDCHGQGQLREVNYVREDGMVRPLLRVTRCPLCGGKGGINYSAKIKGRKREREQTETEVEDVYEKVRRQT